jgi:membrane protease YdiL (CAAX protease family)
MPGRRPFLRQVVILWAAGWIGAVGMLPMFFHLNAARLETAAAKGVTGPLVAALIVIQVGVFLAITVPVGLWAASRLALRAPLSEALATGRNLREAARPFLGAAVLAGAATGVVMWLLGVFVFYPAMPGEVAAVRRGITWQGLPASLYGGITEELLSRLFLLSVLGLAARRLLTPMADGLPAAPFWLANGLAALLFGLGHIPSGLGSVPLTPAVWAYVLVLNGICGMVFGWLYWRKGLEAAMVAHFMVDIVLHVIGPALER